MTNKEIATQFQYLAKLMELHEESSYRIRSYSNAYRNLRSYSEPLMEMDLPQLKQIKGIGDAIGRKVLEIQQRGRFQMLEEFESKTPKGVRELLYIKGLGAKKIRQLWMDLGIESPGELQYACVENRLLLLKGFGQKTQQNIQAQLQYYFQSKDKFLWAKAEQAASDLIEDIEMAYEEDIKVALVGDFLRAMPVLESIDIVLSTTLLQPLETADFLTDFIRVEGGAQAKTKEEGFPIHIFTCLQEQFGKALLQHTGPQSFVAKIEEQLEGLSTENQSEAALFAQAKLTYVEPPYRDAPNAFAQAQKNTLPTLIQPLDIRGVVHAHTTWSDGATSIQALAEYCRTEGYEYLGLTDHSRSAFYANGLTAERVQAQMQEIDEVNAQLDNFRIFKGIESDILYDGSLDYEPEILAQFDFVIASVHAHLRMDKSKATSRLLRAIENPYTRILGHPTGRLLLAREGYPLHHEVIIDACAKHKVAIELNANPNRLDLDWRWIYYALEKGVLISINPDAHSLQGVHDLRYGVLTAQKGGLTAENCLTAKHVEDFAAWCKAR